MENEATPIDGAANGCAEAPETLVPAPLREKEDARHAALLFSEKLAEALDALRAPEMKEVAEALEKGLVDPLSVVLALLPARATS